MLKNLNLFRSKRPAEKNRDSATRDEVLDEVHSAGSSHRNSTADDVSVASGADAWPDRFTIPPRLSSASLGLISKTVLPNPGVSRDDKEYRMSSRERGVALIFNHQTFDVRRRDGKEVQPPERLGTSVDRDTLLTTFERLGFEVRVFDDWCYSQITSVLRRVAKENHVNHDCVAVAVLSHGSSDGRLDAKDQEYEVSELWEPFIARRCHTLAGKPKLFFIQACKGLVADPGVLIGDIVLDAPDCGHDEKRSFPVPSYADILVSYSTFEGLYSFRNTKNGSHYVQTLCKQLEAHGATKDLVLLLTDVNRIVSQMFHSVREMEFWMYGIVQAPSFTSSLTRCVFFHQRDRPLSPRPSPQHCSLSASHLSLPHKRTLRKLLCWPGRV